MTPFTHAVMSDGEIIRKMRWSRSEAKWFKERHPSFEVVALAKPPKQNLEELVGQALW